MTDRLQAIKARLAAANSDGIGQGDALMEFDEYSRTDMDWLIGEVERLQKLASEFSQTDIACAGCGDEITKDMGGYCTACSVHFDKLQAERELLVKVAEAARNLRASRYPERTGIPEVEEALSAWDAYRSSSSSQTAGTEPTSDGKAVGG